SETPSPILKPYANVTVPAPPFDVLVVMAFAPMYEPAPVTSSEPSGTPDPTGPSNSAGPVTVKFDVPAVVCPSTVLWKCAIVGAVMVSDNPSAICTLPLLPNVTVPAPPLAVVVVMD